jgi:hypothetical protein
MNATTELSLNLCWCRTLLVFAHCRSRTHRITMQTLRPALLLALLLSLCFTLCYATSRTLQQEEPVGVASAADPAAVTPQKPTCKWYPPAPPGIQMSKWTARWPSQCMGMTVDRWCDAFCLPG